MNLVFFYCECKTTTLDKGQKLEIAKSSMSSTSSHWNYVKLSLLYNKWNDQHHHESFKIN